MCKLLPEVKLAHDKRNTRFGVIFQLIQELVSGGIYYVRIRPRLLSVRNVAGRKSLEEMPLLALSNGKDPLVLAVGAYAASVAAKPDNDAVLANGFEHPRTIISDFTVAEKTLQYFFSKLATNNFIRPVVVMHALEKTEGGLTQIEIRALQELAMGAGAREAHVWGGRELVDHEFENKKFPGDHWLSEKPKWVKS
mgnify:CR=1 FL=1